MKRIKDAIYFNYRCPYTDRPCQFWDCDNCMVEEEERRWMKGECCEKCKFLYPLKKFVNGDWEYSHVCLLFPFTEEKDEICTAMVIEHPEVQMCEMFDERETINAWSRITELGKELRTFRDGITDENTLVGFNMAVALCNKHLGEKI